MNNQNCPFCGHSIFLDKLKLQNEESVDYWCECCNNLVRISYEEKYSSSDGIYNPVGNFKIKHIERKNNV